MVSLPPHRAIPFHPTGHRSKVSCCPQCATASARTEYDESNFWFNCCCVGGALTRSIIREGLSIEVGGVVVVGAGSGRQPLTAAVHAGRLP